MVNVSLTPRHLRCIQIDLTTFGVDRCGIVYSMSDPLTKAGINLLYLSTFKTANVLVNESLINQTLEVLDIYDDKKDNESKEEKSNNSDKSDQSEKSDNTEVPSETNSNSNVMDVNLKDLDLYDTKKDYGTLAKINPYKDSNYFRGAIRINSDNSYLYNTNNNTNKMMNYNPYKANSVSSLSSSTIINQINYDNDNIYPNNHILNGNPLTNNSNMNPNEKNINTLPSGIGLTNMYAPQSQYSVSISPTTVTAEPSSTTMTTMATTKDSNTMNSQHYITNRSYYDYNYDSKVSSYATNNNYNKHVEGPNLNNTNSNMPSNTINYFQQYHPINSSGLTSDVYATSGFTFK